MSDVDRDNTHPYKTRLQHYCRLNSNKYFYLAGLDFLVINDDFLEQPDEIFVEATLYHGHFQLAPGVKTKPLKYTDSHRFES